MKRFWAILFAMALLILCTGCGAEETSSSAGDYPAMLMVDGVLYQSTSEPVPVEMDESVIKTVSSYTDTEPTEDGQTNFDRSCTTEYGMTSDGLMVLIDLEWIRFAPVERAE